MNMPCAYALEIDWTDPALPRLVGPFVSENEAREWAALNVVNGEWNVAQLARPYLGARP